MEFISKHVKWTAKSALYFGIVVGLGLFIVHISNFFSYLSDDPKTCMNCHVMGAQYATWEHSAHREVATCNDCHVPQDNVFKKYFFKAMDGSRHATIFTFRAEPHAMFISKAGKNAVESNCRRCHSNVFGNSVMPTFVRTEHGKEGECIKCHRDTPHGKVRSLTSSPLARVPVLGSMVPQWLTNAMNQNKSGK